MPFDSNGNWSEEPEPENDWSEPYGSDTRANAVWGVQMFFALIVVLALCVGGWILKGACYYTIGKAVVESGEED